MMQPPTTGTLDLDMLKAVVGDEPEVIADFLADFRRVATTTLEALQSALRSGELERISGLAHRLKSNARTVGAMALGESSARLEGEAAQGRPIAELKSSIEALERELHTVAGRIDRLLA